VSKAVAKVTVVYVIEAVGVVNAVPAVVEVLVAVGAFHAGEPVIVTPPAV